LNHPDDPEASMTVLPFPKRANWPTTAERDAVAEAVTRMSRRFGVSFTPGESGKVASIGLHSGGYQDHSDAYGLTRAGQSFELVDLGTGQEIGTFLTLPVALKAMRVHHDSH